MEIRFFAKLLGEVQILNEQPMTVLNNINLPLKLGDFTMLEPVTGLSIHTLKMAAVETKSSGSMSIRLFNSYLLESCLMCITKHHRRVKKADLYPY